MNYLVLIHAVSQYPAGSVKSYYYYENLILIEEAGVIDRDLFLKKSKTLIIPLNLICDYKINSIVSKYKHNKE